MRARTMKGKHIKMGDNIARELTDFERIGFALCCDIFDMDTLEPWRDWQE